MSLVDTAFSILRAKIGAPRPPPPELIANADQVVQMAPADGLMQWADGTHIAVPVADPGPAPLLTKAHLKNCMLWAVRQNDVVWALEHGPFGKTLESGVIKHTNLTGGDPAFSGGELLVIADGSTVVINGNSGRYRPRSAVELGDVVSAFAQSGYGVWSMGYDEDANRPLPFIGVTPTWVL